MIIREWRKVISLGVYRAFRYHYDLLLLFIRTAEYILERTKIGKLYRHYKVFVQVSTLKIHAKP